MFIKMYAYFQPYLDDSDDILAEVGKTIARTELALPLAARLED